MRSERPRSLRGRDSWSPYALAWAHPTGDPLASQEKSPNDLLRRHVDILCQRCDALPVTGRPPARTGEFGGGESAPTTGSGLDCHIDHRLE